MTKNNILIRNLSPERSVIDIEGTIGVDENLQFSNPGSRVATYEKLTDALLRISEIEAPEVVVNIRSTGGDVNDALLIYEALKSLPGRVVTCCYGYTASAATVIAQAASAGCRRIASGALYLIHNSICAIEGNVAELEASTDLLRKTDERLAALYAERSGVPVDRFIALMAENNGAGRWLSPAEAVEAGLADEVIDDPHREASADGKKSAAAEKNGVEAQKKESAANNRADRRIAEASAGETEAETGAATASVTGSESAEGTEPAEDFYVGDENRIGNGIGDGIGNRTGAGVENGIRIGNEDRTETENGIGNGATGSDAEAPDRFRVGAANLEAIDKEANKATGKEADKGADKEANKATDKGANEGADKEANEEAGKKTGAHFSAKADAAAGGTEGKSADGSAEQPATGWRTLIRHLRNLFAGGDKNAAKTAKETRLTEVRGEGFKPFTPPVDKNIFHIDDPDPLREVIRSRIAFNRGQSNVQPTTTQPVEDPAAYEYQRSANERAYAEDARRMRM